MKYLEIMDTIILKKLFFLIYICKFHNQIYFQSLKILSFPIFN